MFVLNSGHVLLALMILSVIADELFTSLGLEVDDCVVWILGLCCLLVVCWLWLGVDFWWLVVSECCDSCW